MGQTIFWNHFGMVETPMQWYGTALYLDLYLSVLETLKCFKMRIWVSLSPFIFKLRNLTELVIIAA